MGFDFSGLNNAVADVFGEACVIKSKTGSHDVIGTYFAPFEQYQLDEMVRNSPDHMVVMHTDDFDATSAVKGDTMTVRSVVYDIVDFEKDEAEMIAVSLRNP